MNKDKKKKDNNVSNNNTNAFDVYKYTGLESCLPKAPRNLNKTTENSNKKNEKNEKNES
ncbi:hypothetical protein [Cetobacterium sp. ZOR0034]|uniref:hypothetical protein n=1 Tax=Cetobacterium sp. ZOR0034 TaxID=1339239 RepID=UPI0012E0BA33|nr:hypothetical protein [Cetobacterium sp. ZOR0034]